MIWGSFVWWQWGQTERAGAGTGQFDARRLRLLALGVFLLGTAIGAPQLLSVRVGVVFGIIGDDEGLQGVPPGVAGFAPAVAGSLPAVGAAVRTEPQTVVGAD